MPSFLTVAAVIVALIGVVLPVLFSYFIGGEVARYVSPPYGFNDIPDLTGKVAIVTGSNTGIGYVTVRELARKGAKVIVAARSEEKGKEAVRKIKAELGSVPGADLVEFIKLDLGSFAEVKKFVKDFTYKRLKLDMLILNAGVMAPPYGLTVDGFETQIGTNHLGHFLLVKLLMPIIKASKSRLVHVSSIAHMGTFPEGIRTSSFSSDEAYTPFNAYGQSKLANILFSNELARQLNGTGVTSNSLHPGAIKTELIRHVETQIKENAVISFIYDRLNVLSQMSQLDPDGGALTQLYVATSPAVASVSGEYFVPIALNRKATAHAYNETKAKELWAESERLTKPFW